MADNREKTVVEDIDRSIYDIRDAENDAYRMEAGLTPEIVDKLSKEKHDPVWMQQFRLHALQIYNEMPLPDWGPSLEGLDIDHIATYVRPKTGMQNNWKNVPKDIKDTFDRLGIPEAERKSLAGVGAQYDSELVYHNVRKEVAAEGVVYTDMESALTGEYADMVKKYFMKLVPPTDHKFAALHGAVWSGGSFVYVPKGVHLSIPLQSYFRLNAKGAGQFEHTLIIVDEGASLHFIEGCSAPKYNVANLHAGCVELYVKKGAKLRYSTIENWSKNMYNLNTKRALCEEGGDRRVDFRLVRLARRLPLSDERAEGRQLEDGVHRRDLCGRGAEPRYRRQGRAHRQEHKLVYEHPLHQQERRHQYLPQQRHRGEERRRREVLGVLSVADAGFRLPLGYGARDGHPHQGCGGRPRGENRQHQRRRGVLSDEPRHERGGRARADCQRLCGQRLQGAARGIRRGNE